MSQAAHLDRVSDFQFDGCLRATDAVFNADSMFIWPIFNYL